MNRKAVAIAILSIAFPFTGAAQSAVVQMASLAAPMPPMISTLMKNAHSIAEYGRLARYFRQQEEQYRAESAAEKTEHNRRALVNAELTQKYPRPVDSAQYLYDSYLSQADNAALRVRHYDRLTVGQGQHD